MRRRTLGAFAVASLCALAFSSVPAVASPGARSPASLAHSGIDARSIETSKVVETVEIGILGSDEPPVVRKRTLRGRKADAPRRLSLDLRAAVQSRSEACFYARPTWRRYNGFGKLSSKAWYYIEWCGRHGRVSKVLTLSCGGVAAGGFSYDGCKVRRGAVGYSRVNISGEWSFPFRVSVYTLLTRTVTVSSRHYPTGRSSGTWWMYQ